MHATHKHTNNKCTIITEIRHACYAQAYEQ